MAQGTRSFVDRLLTPLREGDTIAATLFAVFVGALTGLVAVGFIYAIEAFQFLGYFSTTTNLGSWVATLPWWQIMLVPTVAGLIVGKLVQLWMPGGAPQGVGHVIEASALRGGDLSTRLGFRAAIISAISIGGGASVGREGPMVHLGASLGSRLAKSLRVGWDIQRLMLGCGVAAGVAASFNAPLAGSIFALELVIGHYALTAFAPVVMAAVAGTIVSRAFLGDQPAFAIPELAIVTPFEFPAFAGLGIITGLLAAGFIRGTFSLQDILRQLPIPRWLLPACAGFVVGLIALVFPHVLGVGYEATTEALNGSFLTAFAIGLLLAKLFATMLCLAAGFGGGVFSPALVTGALLGTAYGSFATTIAPVSDTSNTAVYALIGMAAMAAAVLGAPISTILMAFEITGNYSTMIGAMVAVVVATLISRRIAGVSYFTYAMERQGIQLSGGHDVGRLRHARVIQCLDEKVDRLAETATGIDARNAVLLSSWGQVMLVDENDKLTGMLSLRSLQSKAILDDSVATDLAIPPTMLAKNDSLADAMTAFANHGEAHLPVVESRECMTLIGSVHEHDVNLAYHRVMLRQRGLEDSLPETRIAGRERKG